MENRERFRGLTSNKRELVLETLRELKLDKSNPPSEEVINAGLELLRRSDAEVRYETVWALCLHWGDLRMLPMLQAMLEGQERDTEVLIVAARAACSMLEQHGQTDVDGSEDPPKSGASVDNWT